MVVVVRKPFILIYAYVCISAGSAAIASSRQGPIIPVAHKDLAGGVSDLAGNALAISCRTKVLGGIVPLCLAGGQAQCGHVWAALFTAAGAAAAPLAADAGTHSWL